MSGKGEVMIIRTYDQGTVERKRLQEAAAAYTLLDGRPHWVEDVLYDLGTRKMWTSVLRESEWGGTQVLQPEQVEAVVAAGSREAVIALVRGFIKDTKRYR